MNLLFYRCEFLTPTNKTYQVEGDSVIDGNNPVQDVQGLSQDENGAKVCGLKFAKFSSQDFGWWSCDLKSDNLLHRGTFKVNKVGEWPKDIRLPNDIEVSGIKSQPFSDNAHATYFLQVSRYDIELTPDLITNFTTDGKLKMYFKTLADLNRSKNKLTLHSKQIKIKEESVKLERTKFFQSDIGIKGHEYDLDREFYVIHLDQDLEPNTDYVLSIDFMAVLNDDLSGFYRSKYTKVSFGQFHSN